MELFFEILLTALCSAGLALAGWWLFSRLLRPLPGTDILVLIPGIGDGEGLEQAVRSLMWLRSLGLLRCPVTIRDRGLTPEGRRLARELCRRWPAVELEL